MKAGCPHPAGARRCAAPAAWLPGAVTREKGGSSGKWVVHSPDEAVRSSERRAIWESGEGFAGKRGHPRAEAAHFPENGAFREMGGAFVSAALSEQE